MIKPCVVLVCISVLRSVPSQDKRLSIPAEPLMKSLTPSPQPNLPDLGASVRSMKSDLTFSGLNKSHWRITQPKLLIILHPLFAVTNDFLKYSQSIWLKSYFNTPCIHEKLLEYGEYWIEKIVVSYDNIYFLDIIFCPFTFEKIIIVL